MSDYGVTGSGFVRKRFPEQLNQLYTELKTALGSDIALTPDTVLGVLANIMAERHTAVWELIEQVYSAMYPMSATDSNLDRAVSFTGVSRLQAQPSSVGVVWYGKGNTVIPQYTEVKNSRSQVSYYNDKQLTIRQAAAYELAFTPASTAVNTNDEFFLTINGVKYRYVTDRSSIKYAMENLAAALSASTAFDTVLSDVTLTVTAVGSTSLNLSAYSANLSLASIGSYGTASTDGESTDLCDAGEISEMVDLINGLEKVNNPIEGSAGRAIETDSALYNRYHKGVWRTGAGTLESIYANLLEVNGVTAAAVYQNTQSTTVNSLPAHSLYCVVKGGLNADIAACIFNLAPVGITLHGTTSVGLRDSQNNRHTVKFSRPKKVFIWVNVVAETFTDESEYAKTGYAATIIDNILAYGESLNIGNDVILQRIAGKCVEVEGVGKVTVTLGKTALLSAAEPTYRADNITIGYDEEAVFDKTLIRIS